MPLQLQRIVISTDESVVAAESYCDINNKKMSYWLAYDFRNSISYGSAMYPMNEKTNLIKARGDAIEKLLLLRGGIGQEYSKDKISSMQNKLSYLEWKRWQKQEDKAEENCSPWTPADSNMLPN